MSTKYTRTNSYLKPASKENHIILGLGLMAKLNYIISKLEQYYSSSILKFDFGGLVQQPHHDSEDHQESIEAL